MFQIRLRICVLALRHKDLPHLEIDLAILRAASERLPSGDLSLFEACRRPNRLR